jgi:hypothetical protein
MQNLSIESYQARSPNRDKNYWREVIETWEKSSEHQKHFCARLPLPCKTKIHGSR